MSSSIPTFPVDEADWNSQAAWNLPAWAEPVMVASILIASMVITRRRGYRIVGRRRSEYNLLNNEPRLSNEELPGGYMIRTECSDNLSVDSISTAKYPPKKRRCWGVAIYTPNTARLADSFFSRALQKFPFLMEIFYCIVIYAFYRCTSVLSQAMFSETGIWDVAQDHGLAVLEFEQFSILRFLWPITELQVQQWFMEGHQSFLTALNRSYALIHIPVTVGFIAWYYYAAPSHASYAVVRRTMTLTNFLAFCIFIIYPCMPPRLLPLEYGFIDSVRRTNPQSVWMTGKYANLLAAMPSMRFGNAFCIGCTLLYHSGIFRRTLETGESRKSRPWALLYVVLSVAYPLWVLLSIVATANHYYLDACVAVLVTIISFLCNRVFIALSPLEDLSLWCLILEKPVPTTGERSRRSLQDHM